MSPVLWWVLRWLSPTPATMAFIVAQLTPFAQAASPETLTLDQAIERAFARNLGFRSQVLSLQGAEYSYDDAFDQMFVPKIGFSFSTGSNYTLATLPGKPKNFPAHSQGYPASQAQIALGQYTIFNFWRDYIGWEQARLSWIRAKESHQEAERSLRFQVIGAFYRYKTDQEKVDAAKRSLEVSNAIVELVRSRQRVGQATEDEVKSSENDAIASKTAYSGLVLSVKNDLWALNQILGDTIDTQYNLVGSLKYVPIKLTVDQALRIYLDSSPAVKGAKLGLRSAELSLELAEKNRLPLPTVNVSGLTFSFNNGYYGSTNSFGTDAATGNTFIDLSFAMSVSFPILGPGGFLNHRAIQSARVSRESAEISYLQTIEGAKVALHGAVNGIKQQEETVAGQRTAFQNANSVLDSAFSKISSRNVNRLELRDAIVQARNSQLDLADGILGHVQAKLGLAEQIGVDMLPGDSF